MCIRDSPPAPGETWDEYQTSTWSIDERVVVDRALAWADEEENRSRKLALVFLTGSTHHPYEVPKDVTPREPIENTLQKYEHVVRFTDEVIQSLVSGLYARNRPPLLAVVGDHGQAFGKRHTGNFTHKHFLYEENVKNFMLLSHPNLSPGLVSRRAFIGDVMPTLVDALGGTTLPVPGRSMLRDPGEPRIFHFHKSAHPQQWGLVDGDLKYINEVVGGKPEIYDLATDPLERKNIAAKHPERVENYQKMAAAWYASTNEEYLKRLAGYKAKVESLSETDLMGYGPKRLAFGYGRGNGFRKHSDAFGPDHEITAFAWVLPWEKDKNVTYVWRGPGGEDVRQKMVWKPDWSTVWTFYDGPRPIPEGTWTVTIYAGARELISGSFDVRAATEDP